MLSAKISRQLLGTLRLSNMRTFLIVLCFVGMILSLYAALTVALWIAWNLVVAGVFHGPALSFIQAIGVFVLLTFAAGVLKARSK